MNGKPVAVTLGALYSTVTVASQELAAALVAGKLYQFVSSTNCYIKQGAETQTAAAAADNLLCPANVPFYIHGSNGAFLSIIRVSADGVCTLHPVQEV